MSVPQFAWTTGGGSAANGIRLPNDLFVACGQVITSIRTDLQKVVNAIRAVLEPTVAQVRTLTNAIRDLVNHSPAASAWARLVVSISEARPQTDDMRVREHALAFRFDRLAERVYFRGRSIPIHRGAKFRVLGAIIEAAGECVPYSTLYHLAAFQSEHGDAKAGDRLRVLISRINCRLQRSRIPVKLAAQRGRGYMMRIACHTK